MASDRKSQAQRLKRYRKLYSEAKRRGLVTGKYDGRSFVPSSYMKTKLNKLEPYLNENYKAVTVRRDVGRAFKENVSPDVPFVSGQRALVKAGSDTQISLKRGQIKRVRKMRSGEHEEIILPFNYTSIDELEAIIENNPWLDEFMRADSDEVYAFKIGEFPSLGVFDNLGDMVKKLGGYNSIENDKNNESFKTITLYRSHSDNWDWQDFRDNYRAKKEREKSIERAKYYKVNKKPTTKAEREKRNARLKNTQAYERQKARQKQRRNDMTDAERAAYNEKVRIRMKKMRDKKKAEKGKK